MNLVNELQVSAESDDVLTVLRKTRRLASKLGRQDITDWLQAEQNGYSGDQEIPEYRVISGSYAYNTNGYVPAGYGYVRNGVAELPSIGITPTFPLKDSISSVLSTISKMDSTNIMCVPIVQWSKECQMLRSRFEFNPFFAQQISFLIKLHDAQIKAIPEQIKDKVLAWACDLEAAGLTGEGLTFSTKEKEIANSVTFNLNNCNIDQLNNQGKNLKG